MLDHLFGLHGRTCLVTGDGAIPRAVADLLSKAGAVVHRISDRLDDDRAIATLIAGLSDLDILINGVLATGSTTLDKVRMDDWDAMIALNLRGAFMQMREAARVMRRHGRGGRLITLSSIGAVHPVLHGNYAYGASRAGVSALTRQFALDCAVDRITANAILIGAVPSQPPIAGADVPSGPGTREEHLPLGLGKPMDVAPLALFLAGNGARYITGTSIPVDGGFLVA